jgi:hypothetical protein
MKKVWSIRLQRNYSDESLSHRDYDVLAENAKEAIDKAISTHKRLAKKNYDDMDYRCAINIELHSIIK